MSAYRWSDPSVTVFVIIPLVLAVLFAFGVARAWRRAGESRAATRRAIATSIIGVTVWMAGTIAVAHTGILREWDRTPPPFLLFALSVVAIACAIAFGPAGTRLAHHLPLWGLVAVQSFRLPLEFAMHRMYERGIMPVQMSYSGSNFDILTGLTAIVVAALVANGRGNRGLVAAWNALGLALLMNIVAVAILSTPRFRYFGDQQLNTWITYPPFVWLPAVMVLAALAGHLIIFRAIGRRRHQHHHRFQPPIISA